MVKKYLKHYFFVFIGLAIAFGIASILLGEVYWNGLLGLIIGLSISKIWRLKKRDDKDTELPQVDERVRFNFFRQSTYILLTSQLLLLAYLLVMNLLQTNSHINSNLLSLYIVTVLMLVFFSPLFPRDKE